MRNATRRLAAALLLTLTTVASVHGADTTLISAIQPAGTMDVSLRNEVNASIDRALDWLAAQQREDGSWSNGNFPALTALPARTFIASSHPMKPRVLGAAIGYIRSCVREDGGIYRDMQGRKGGGLSSYNTAICMTTLHATGDRSLAPIVLKARRFMAAAQHLGGDVYRGGFGYDAHTDRKYTDLMNTYYAVRAMRTTQDVEDLRPSGEKRIDINWSETVKYITRMQNKPETGPDQSGGFFYKPGQSKAGATTNDSGAVVFRSYGSITYVGLLAMVYANVSRDDVRVRSAYQWSTRHWSLEQNPGMGRQGLYFFYQVLSKALAAYEVDLVPLPDGSLLNWREEVAKKLVGLQKIDPKTGHGFWSNDTGRFWENDPLLVTAYCLLALQEL